jgi:hypothetical protein
VFSGILVARLYPARCRLAFLGVASVRRSVYKLLDGFSACGLAATLARLRPRNIQKPVPHLSYMATNGCGRGGLDTLFCGREHARDSVYRALCRFDFAKAINFE